jgi:hypothetical protein
MVDGRHEEAAQDGGSVPFSSRSRKGFPSIEEAKDFVESFRPWELYGTHGVTVDPEVRPALESATTDTAGTPGHPAQPMVADPAINERMVAVLEEELDAP